MKDNTIELLKALIVAYRSFSFIEDMVNCCELSLSVNRWESIAYLMGIDLTYGSVKIDKLTDKQSDEITERYCEIYEKASCKSDLSIEDAAHLIYSKFQAEIERDLQQFPFLAVELGIVVNGQKAA